MKEVDYKKLIIELVEKMKSKRNQMCIRDRL